MTDQMTNQEAAEPQFWIQTQNGVFDLEEPEEYNYTIEEIAVVLSRTLRFGGHTKVPYTVAQHSIFVAALVEAKCDQLQIDFKDTRTAKMHALLHDAHEAYTTDLTTPMKNYLSQETERLTMLEHNVQRAIENKLIPDNFTASGHIYSLIKRADIVALVSEAIELFPRIDRNWLAQFHVDPVPYNMARIYGDPYTVFLNTYNNLFRWGDA